MLSYEWKANNVRCQIGGDNYVNGLLRTDWKLIATKYKNADAVWAYDIANEPVFNYIWPLNNDILLWRDLADTIVKAIREIDGVKPVIIQSLNYGITMQDVKPIDFSIPNIIYSVHMYDPHLFTHQTLPGYTVAYSYPGVIDGKYYDKDTLRKLLQPLKDYQDKYRVPIYIGEFSAIRWTPNNSTYNYLHDCLEIFEKYNWDWSYQSYREWHGWSVEYSTGYYDMTVLTSMTDREQLLHFYFQKEITGINDSENEIISSICYPNPAPDQVFIPVKNLNLNFGNIEIVDMQGRLMMNKCISEKEVAKIDISTFSNGLYFYNIKNDTGKKVERGKFSKIN